MVISYIDIESIVYLCCLVELNVGDDSLLYWDLEYFFDLGLYE